MRVLVASEAHFVTSSSGAICARGPEDYRFWSSYREDFDEVGVLARVRRSQNALGLPRADGDGVIFHPLDDYHGPWEYGRCLRGLRQAVAQAVNAHDAFVLRAPGAVAYLVWREIRRHARPYAVEVLGDPWESLRPDGLLPSPARAIARRWSRARLEQLCREAPLVCYVARGPLERRYPSGGRTAFFCSDVRLRGLAREPEIAGRLARIQDALSGRRPWQIGFVGSLETLNKAPEIHLHAVRICHQRGLCLRFSMAGDGRHRAALERLARRLDIEDIVQFRGALPPGPPIDTFLDSLDLFVLASRTEALPRALLEAMARGCPAIASAVGGIPEVLPPANLVAPSRADLLAARLAEVLRDPARLAAMGRRNLETAGSYCVESLAPVRREFLRRLRHLAAAGLTSLQARSGR